MDGKFESIYPALACNSFKECQLNTAAHRIFPSLSQEAIAAFMYVPLAALIFAPIAKLPPLFALWLWQVLSVVALVVACKCIVGSKRGDVSRCVWLSFLFLPVQHVLAIGQTDLLIGLLPLALGYALLHRGKDIQGGLCWSLLILKPQSFLPALICAGMLALRKRLGPLIGTVIGSGVILALTLVVCGWSTTQMWLHTMQVCQQTFALNTACSPATAAYCSLPLAALLLLPAQFRQYWQPMAAVWMALIASVASAGFVWSERHRSAAPGAASEAQATAGGITSTALDKALCLSLLITPLSVIYFQFYSLVLLLPVMWLCLFPSLGKNLQASPTGKTLLGVVLLVDVYFVALLFLPQIPVPATVAHIAALAFLCATAAAQLIRRKSAV